MPHPLFITQHGELRRKDNTLHFVGETLEKAIPLAQVSEIHCVARVTLTSGAIDLLSVEGIPVHFYTVEGLYKGSFIPKTGGNGKLKIAQVQHYLDEKKRLYIAQQIVQGIKNTMLKSLRGQDTSRLTEIAVGGATIEEIRGIEAKLWREYYHLFAQTLKMKFRKRTRKPPKDEVNALISYGNSILYGLTLSAIIRAKLDPDISFLHEPMQNRFSLSLDLSEPFKPLIVMSAVKYAINKGMIRKHHFRKPRKKNAVYLSAEGRRKFIQALNMVLSRTVYYPRAKRNVSYRLMMDYEAKRLANHLLGRRKYKAFKPWW
ncbi:type I-B CRISPR-associated endonuclease Cas1b [Thermococcus sp. LS2]|uniref:type I-B CRISPR-associated endonuclease Cas1b n=1 Tax=Thermococcus sp. LS2 TaxID=1638260 RepID=UPI00143CB63F|nr:type I-B CRISPR-associated endonuclease Cas1b [Thermococcus sp. LS2]NJE13337.1 type I-B CRISPR-associated endonuclease Cas1 [Thermococcus sp. LS2]